MNARTFVRKKVEKKKLRNDYETERNAGRTLKKMKYKTRKAKERKKNT